jgi:hypothetical protein
MNSLIEEGNILTVGNYKFVDGTLGKGSFGTVRLAQLMEGPSTPLSTPIGRSQHVTQKRHSGDGSMTAMTPTKLDEKMNKVDMRTARKEARRKTASAPYGQDPFAEDKGKVVPTMAVGQLGLIVKHGLKKASDQLGSFFDEKPQADNLYAVKIFHKSL